MQTTATVTAKHNVAMNFCRFNTSGTSEFETSELQASFVKFATDASAGDSMIFAYDDASYKYLDQDDLKGFFGPVDGTDNDYYLWKGHSGAEQLRAQPL